MSHSRFEIRINPKFSFLQSFIDELPRIYPEVGTVIYSGRNELKVIEIDGLLIVVKSFKVPLFINKIAYSYFRDSKAKRSFNFALEIERRGMDTPSPIAYINEFKTGLLYRSFYICVYEKNAVQIAPYVYGDIYDEKVLNDLAYYISSLHKSGILHLDLSPGNILLEQVNGENHFSIIDINRLQLKTIDKDTGYANFARLSKSLKVSTYIAERYAVAMGYDVKEAINTINTLSDNFFRNKTFSFASKEIKKKYGFLKSLIGPIQYFRLLHSLRLICPLKGVRQLLFNKEEQYYFEYIESADIRKVFLRENKYQKP